VNQATTNKTVWSSNLQASYHCATKNKPSTLYKLSKADIA